MQAQSKKSAATRPTVPKDARTGEFRVAKPYVSSAAAEKARAAVRTLNGRLKNGEPRKK